ncbi:MAG: acyl-CoA dehydrogenase family protein [Alphaproteobacteria bacterium]|nr:acyl-CoA dehydrogenase family protein [Alphaproteobacteria bacterium]
MTDPDTLRMLEEAARGHAPFDAARVRGWRGTAPGFDRGHWQAMAEQGWLSILVPEEAGGLGLDLDAAAAVATVLGRSAAPEPFVAAGIVAPKLLSSCPPSEGRDARLARVIGGEAIACLAWQDVAGSLEVGAAQVTAASEGDGFAIDGECRFVPVPDADAFLVTANANGELALFWIDAGTKGLTIDRETTADGNSQGWMRFSGVNAAGTACIANGAGVEAMINEAIDYGTIGNCAELLGNMERCLELTLEYLKTRTQFGQMIGKFQVLQHRAVDLWMNKEVARHALTASLNTVMAPNVPAAGRARAASSAKARIGQTALALANDAVQLHGAIGFTDEYDLALYVNRAIAIAPYLGNAAEHLKRYGELKQRRTEAAA